MRLRYFSSLPLPGIRKLVAKDPSDVMKRKINEAQQQLCTSLTALTNKYPFNPQAKDDASMDQVRRVFAPKDGTLAGMREALHDLVVKSGGVWSQKPDAPLKLSRRFLEFFNRMSEISDALFPQQGDDPMKYKLSVRANPAMKQVTGTIDGEPVSMSTKEYSWPGSKPGVDLRVEPAAGGSTPMGGYSGRWAIFKLMASADHKAGTNLFPLVNVKAESSQSLPQSILQDGSAIVFEVTQFPNGVQNAFDKGFFAVSCPKQVFE